MMGDAPHGSIARRDSPRPDLLVFEIRAKIPKDDIEWMSAEVDRASDIQDEIDMLLIMTNFEGSDLAAKFSGEAAAVQMRSLGHVRKYAVVGAPTWAGALIELSGAVSPVETKTFQLGDEALAWRWVDEGRKGR